ncbi:SpaH/EbpB family LPXTG-anchored major pilin [Enterococcus sp. AZ196]|uniref:SpaH/EbpB family LPXTG-anchored major pilin n=1 Tax=Enterococcus sp. AZ196 TaxID=2774659 RepID=UPI003D27A461
MNKKWISKAALSLGVLTMLGSAGAGLGTVAFAAPPAQNISGNAASDNTSKRSITIWKYEINSTAELGERGDGESLDPATAPDLTGKKVMQDVNFEIVRVIPKTGVSLTDPLKQTEVAGDYTIDGTFTAQQGKTAADSSLTFDVGTGKAGDGIYLVREIKDSSGKYTYTDPATGETGKKISKPMDPFFVHLPQTKRDDTSKLIYDVHVHPKNIVTDTELDKTIEEGKGYSIKAGNDFTWEATTKLPSGLYSEIDKEMTITNWLDPADDTIKDLVIGSSQLPYDLYANYFKVTDTLDKRLLLQDVEVYVLDKTGSPVKLTNGVEYEVTLDGTKITAPNKVEDLTETADKEVIVSLTQAGMKKVTLDEDTHLQVVYKVTTNKDFNGTIANEYDVDYLLPGQDPFHETSEENPEYYDGGFDILKTKEDKTSILPGAEFHIATSEADANAKKYLASDGNSYTLNDDGTSTPALPTGVTYLKAISGADGKAEFNGLELEWFTDTNSNGKQDPSIPAEDTWPAVDPGNGDPFISKKYWVVETKAPDGYELIKDPQEITVTLDTADDAVVEMNIINKKKTDLPFTGGTGMTLMIVIALGAIVIGTATMTIEKKRRQA